MTNKEYNKKYYQEHREAIKAKSKAYRQTHKEYYADYYSNYSKDHSDERKTYQREWMKQYRKTKNGRATMLVVAYKSIDKKKNLVCTLTEEWLIKNIFSNRCVYCGESDWQKLGCDRLDNTKGHTPDNCVPCCLKCNSKKQDTYYGRYMLLNTPQFLKISK